MPGLAQHIMMLAPTTHFVAASQAILYRAASFQTVWPNVLALAAIGAAFFLGSVAYFRRSLSHLG
jgi:ABC-2 type transport system permease protein